MLESEIKSLIINIRNILLVRESTRKHIYWLSSIHFTLQYFRWIQYQLFKTMINQKLLSLHQKSSKKSSFSRSNSNHLSSSRILQNRFYFTSNSIILSHLLDCFNTSIKKLYESDCDIKSKSSHISIQHFVNTSTSKLFSLLESQFESLSVNLYISIFFFCFNDIFNIESKNQSIRESHFLFENQLRILYIRLTNQCHFFVHSMNSISRQKINNTSSQEVFEHTINDSSKIWYRNHLSLMRNLRIHSHLSSQTSFLFYFDDELNNSSSNLSSIFDIEIIFLTRKSFDILFIHLSNQFDFFNINDEVDNISNSDLKSVLQISSTRIQYSSCFNTEIIQLLREHYEIISVSIAKNLVSFVLVMNSISSHQKRQEFSSNIIHQHSKSRSSFLLESI